MLPSVNHHHLRPQQITQGLFDLACQEVIHLSALAFLVVRPLRLTTQLPSRPAVKSRSALPERKSISPHEFIPLRPATAQRALLPQVCHGKLPPNLPSPIQDA